MHQRNEVPKSSGTKRKDSSRRADVQGILLAGLSPRRARCGLLTFVAAMLLTHSALGETPAPRFIDLPREGGVKFEPALQAEEEAVPPHFHLDPHEFNFQSKPGKKSGRVRMHVVTFPSPVATEFDENNTVHAEYFQPAGDGPFPACVVLHILGGDFLLAETVANHLAQHGIAALFVKMPYYGERRPKNSSRRMISRVPSETVAGMTQAVLDIRRASAWLAGRPEVDRQRLGITGISLGGIMSALAASGEPRLRNIAIVLGGGNLADALWANEVREARGFREEWVAAGGSHESFREALAPIDPATHGHLLKGRRVLMIAASHDEVIVPDSARALWESIGREPELVWLDAGHYTALRYLPRELVRLDRFFSAGP
jgi:cephalosporin-C deacetylase-like acetyl esterase